MQFLFYCMDYFMENIPSCIIVPYPHTKTNVMQISNFHRNAIILIVLSLNSYAIVKGIIHESFMGILLSMASMGALFYIVRLMKKLKEMEATEDEQLFH